MDWISVKDKLPLNGEMIIVCLENGAVTESMLLSGIFQRPEMLSFRAYTFTSNPVTHWQPLPQPPKEATP